MNEIKERFKKGYTMSTYGTREALHEQMRSDIEALLQALNLVCVSNSETEVCVHPFKFVVIYGSRCHCFKCGCDIDTRTDR